MRGPSWPGDLGASEREIHVPLASQDTDGGAAIRRVNETLQGTVLGILAPMVPELRALPPEQAYTRTLDNLGLLQRCFAVFNARRDRFHPVLVDKANRPVVDSTTELACGRTLDQVVAMIVRSAAKRHFRHVLGRHRGSRPDRHPLWRRGLVRLLGGRAPIAAHVAPLPALDPARALYEALKPNLRHDWQLALVPVYAAMTPLLARALGEKLLDLKDPALLRRVIADPDEAAKLFELPEQQRPVPRDHTGFDRTALARMLGANGRLDPAVFTVALRDPALRRELRDGDRATTRPLGLVGAMAAKLLVTELGLAPRQLAALLLVAHDLIGPDQFSRFFGPAADAAVVMRMAQRGRQGGLGPHSSPQACAAFARALFARPTAAAAGTDRMLAIR